MLPEYALQDFNSPATTIYYNYNFIQVKMWM